MRYKAKKISNIIKLLIVIFIFFEYHYQSLVSSSALTTDECRGLLFIALSCFCILFPIDASVFIKNFYSAKGIKTNIDKDLLNNGK